MAFRSLNDFRSLRRFLSGWQKRWLARRWNIHIDPSASISLSACLRALTPGGVSVGPETLVAFKTYICSIDPVTGEERPIRIGRRCFIGGGSMLYPGVTIGDEAIVGAGAVVAEDVAPRSVVGGNPAKVLKRDIKVGRFGRLEGADENSRRLWKR